MNLDHTTLQLSEIDLHFHAGTERSPEYSARDFIDYAVATGRKFVGVTVSGVRATARRRSA